MSTAALIEAPLPPGADEPFAAPAPEACGWCGGECCEPDWEFAAIPCGACEGAGYRLAEFDLPRTRTYGHRRVRYVPLCGIPELTIETAVKPGRKPTREVYQVAEFEHDWAGRGFRLVKASDPKRWHTVYVGPDGVRCTCEGETYQTSAKANQAAHDAGEETYPTYGCKHADATAALLLGGWFDL